MQRDENFKKQDSPTNKNQPNIRNILSTNSNANNAFKALIQATSHKIDKKRNHQELNNPNLRTASQDIKDAEIIYTNSKNNSDKSSDAKKYLIYNHKHSYKIMVAYAKLKSRTPDMTYDDVCAEIKKRLNIIITKGTLYSIVNQTENEVVIDRKKHQYQVTRAKKESDQVIKLPSCLSMFPSTNLLERYLNLLEQIPEISNAEAALRLVVSASKLLAVSNENKEYVNKAKEKGRSIEEADVLSKFSSSSSPPSKIQKLDSKEKSSNDTKPLDFDSLIRRHGI